MTPDPITGTLIVTHRTPNVIAEVVRVFFQYWCQTDANHCLQVTFERKPIYYADTELLDNDAG